MVFCIPVKGVDFGHFLFELGNLFHRWLFGSGTCTFVTALLGRRGFEQCVGVRHADGAAGHHQFHRFNLARRLHVAQNARHIRGELLVLQQGDGLRRYAVQQIGTAVDGVQVDVKGACQSLYTDPTLDSTANPVS